MNLRTPLITLAALLALPLAAQTAPKAHVVKKAATYECPICHHKVDAAKAKSLRYTCPVDKGRLAPVKVILPHK